MKRDVARYTMTYLACQLFKAEHQRLEGMLQPLQIPEWKWESISMDFILDIPKTTNRYDTIWVIVDRLIKSAHFLPIRMTFSLEQPHYT